MNAIAPLTPETMHRGAKLFMDRGDAASYEAALQMLGALSLDILVGEDAAGTDAGKAALLTAVNLARRTMLGGVRVVGCPDLPARTRLAAGSLRAEIVSLGGQLAQRPDPARPTIVIGHAPGADARALRVTWDGWAGGVAPVGSGLRLPEDGNVTLAPIVAAALAVSESFQAAIRETPGAGRRAVGLSLWEPRADWTTADGRGPQLAWLPGPLWFIGLGNLGQAFLWCLGALPYARPSEAVLTLSDDDEVQPSNDSTSVLTAPAAFGLTKARMTAAWAERRGFRTRVVERRFGPWLRRADAAGDPSVALCGVDNALARIGLEDAGFSGVFEAGLGAGPGGYLNLSTHSFPGAVPAKAIWSRVLDIPAAEAPVAQPAYAAARAKLGECGVVTLASRTIGVPSVGMTAATLVLGEILRRLHGGAPLDALSLSLACPDEVEVSGAVIRLAYQGGITAAG